MATWTIDTAHSEIGFKVKHLVISTVSGKFNSFEGKLEGDPTDLTNTQISFTADIDSITTGNEQRDGQLHLHPAGSPVFYHPFSRNHAVKCDFHPGWPLFY